MREEIVEAALDQFHVLGFNAAGVKDITDAAGVPKGSFYNHFESKESLALVALRRYETTRRLAELADTTVPPLRRLREHFEFLRHENVGNDYTRGCLFANFGAEVGDHSDGIRTAVREGLRHWSEPIAAAIAAAQRDGDVHAGHDPATLARFVLNAWEGAVISARADRSSASFDAFFDIVFGTLLC